MQPAVLPSPASSTADPHRVCLLVLPTLRVNWALAKALRPERLRCRVLVNGRGVHEPQAPPRVRSGDRTGLFVATRGAADWPLMLESAEAGAVLTFVWQLELPGLRTGAFEIRHDIRLRLKEPLPADLYRLCDVLPPRGSLLFDQERCAPVSVSDPWLIDGTQRRAHAEWVLADNGVRRGLWIQESVVLHAADVEEIRL
ncbi:hypothetical protein J2T57_001727 [Natronocella acetinitrilica]|uniref:Uncharacterized protein n=1 Tax=Natronocella acetinitrilica TaxID=414046 RepID=A0AAE3G2M0_9GAMM|nr:hypothetical protein [Natronocella acetinitrilica]MCP1674625.1 hypothetical protein [Natronocella acetinitrilica]